MSIPQWALESGVLGIIKDAEKEGKVESLALSIEQIVRGFFPGKSEQVMKNLVEQVLFPLGNRLLKGSKP